MQNASEAIRVFFAEYEEGANTFDVAKNQRERAEAWLVAGPQGVGIAHNDESFPEKLKKRQQQLQDIGFRSAVITLLKEEKLDQHYSLVKTGWRQHYDVDGTDIPVDITVDYLVRVESKGAVKIICSIAHEDEDELLRQKGVIL